MISDPSTPAMAINEIPMTIVEIDTTAAIVEAAIDSIKVYSVPSSKANSEREGGAYATL
jgi:hypothetical protein